MKRIILFLAFIMVIGLVSSCGNDEDIFDNLGKATASTGDGDAHTDDGQVPPPSGD